MIINNECRKLGFEPKIVSVCSNASSILSLVDAEIGAAILPRPIAAMMPYNRIKILDIVGFSIQTVVAIIWLKDCYLSKSAQRFIEIFQNKGIENQ